MVYATSHRKNLQMPIALIKYISYFDLFPFKGAKLTLSSVNSEFEWFLIVNVQMHALEKCET